MNLSIDEQKNELRKKIKAQKAQVPLETKKICSGTIWEQLENEPVFQKAKTVMLYWSMPDEVHTHDFVEKWSAQKTIILPSVCGTDLELKVFEGQENMCEGECFSILEPTKNFTEPLETIDLIVVPGVAFDKQNNRMGRGKAFYDKLLQTTSCYKVGVCFNFQFFENIPINEFDIKMNKVIVEKE